jgi:hypothetical protein
VRAGNSAPQLLQEQIDKAEQAKQVTRKHLNSIATVLARVNSVLTGRRIKVNIVEQPEYKAPAWSSTSEMWLNLSEIKFDLSAHSILSLQGLSFHELSHLLYTPRNGHALPIWIREQDNAQALWESFNCLEDMRIETLLTGYLPTVENWLTATIVDYLLGNDEAVTTAFPLVYGRQYLPVELRQLAVDKYKVPSDIKALATIIDEYRLLIFASNDDTERAKELIVAFNNLLDNLPKQPQSPQDGGNGNGEGTTVTIRIHSPNGHGNRPVEGVESSSVRPAKTAQQKRDQQTAIANQKKNVVLDVVIQDKSDETSKDNSDSDSKPINAGGCGGATQPKSKDNSFDQDEKTSDDEFADEFEDFDDELSDEVDDSDGNGGNSAGNAQGVTGSNQQVTDVLNDVMNDIVEQLSKEINRIAKQAGVEVELTGGNAKTPDKARYSNVPASPELVLSARAFARELERLRADHDPAWLKQTDNGKINATRYLMGNDLDTCFDEWQEGRDDVTAIEAVILLDRSSSMAGHNAKEAYKSMWAIKKALESVEATTTVVLFDSSTTLLYDKNEKAGTTIRDSGANGGTNPKDSILYAKKVLAESDKPIKLLCMITDGAWDSEAGEQAVTEMKNAGVLTCQALLYEGRNLSADYLNGVRHSFELVTQLQSAKDITTLGKSLVRLAISRNLVKQ